MADLTVNIAGVEFKNPVITASGTFGFGRGIQRVLSAEGDRRPFLQGDHPEAQNG